MILRLSGSHTIGKDLDGDGLPDIPLIYDMEEGSRIEFPLNFCPGETFKWTNATTGENMKQSHLTPNQLTHPCIGQWGIALKEWQVIKQVQMFLIRKWCFSDNCSRHIRLLQTTSTDSR